MRLPDASDESPRVLNSAASLNVALVIFVSAPRRGFKREQQLVRLISQYAEEVDDKPIHVIDQLMRTYWLRKKYRP